MMETTDFRKRDDFADRMDRARIRRVFLQGQMKTGFVVVTEISNHISEVSGTYFPKPLMTKSVASRVSEYLPNERRSVNGGFLRFQRGGFCGKNSLKTVHFFPYSMTKYLILLWSGRRVSNPRPTAS